jgi:hypothetical protein
MRSNARYLAAALAVAAIPLSAGAVPAHADRQAVTGAQRGAPTADACGAGWQWEQAGYAKHGKWRPAHCAPQEMSY